MAEARSHKEKKEKKHKEKEKKPRKVILEVDNVSDVSIEESFETDSCSSDGSGCRVYSMTHRPDKVFHVQTRDGRQKILQRMASESARSQTAPVKETKAKKDKKIQEKAEKFPWLNSEATSSSAPPPKKKEKKEKRAGAVEIKKAPIRP